MDRIFFVIRIESKAAITENAIRLVNKPVAPLAMVPVCLVVVGRSWRGKGNNDTGQEDHDKSSHCPLMEFGVPVRFALWIGVFGPRNSNTCGCSVRYYDRTLRLWAMECLKSGKFMSKHLLIRLGKLLHNFKLKNKLLLPFGSIALKTRITNFGKEASLDTNRVAQTTVGLAPVLAQYKARKMSQGIGYLASLSVLSLCLFSPRHVVSRTAWPNSSTSARNSCQV